VADEPTAVDPMPERPPLPPTWRDVLDRVLPPERAGLLRWAAAAAVVVVVGLVGWWALRPAPAPAVESALPLAGQGGTEAGASSTVPAAASVTTTVSTAPAELVVHAAGAVVAPGVHRVAAGSRVADLLAAAGGPAADADLDRVNLAAPLADGQRVWFPRVGEAAPPSVSEPGGGGVGSAGGGPAATSGPIDLNDATAEELEALPGVGPSIAAAIVEYRERNGPYGSVDDLLDVPGIGPARLDQLRPLVTV
jgi:competence protein ComEA